MAGGTGQRVVAGAEKALEMLRELPRISLANLRSNPGAKKQVYKWWTSMLNQLINI